MTMWYAIVETDRGLTVAEVLPESSVEETATELGGVVVDPGPYKSYTDAYDALVSLVDDDEEVRFYR